MNERQLENIMSRIWQWWNQPPRRNLEFRKCDGFSVTWARNRALTFLGFLLTLPSCVSSHIAVGGLPKDVSCVAVLPFEVRYDPNLNSETLSEFLALELESSGTIGVAGPLEIAKRFKELQNPLPPI